MSSLPDLIVTAVGIIGIPLGSVQEEALSNLCEQAAPTIAKTLAVSWTEKAFTWSLADPEPKVSRKSRELGQSVTHGGQVLADGHAQRS